MAMFLYCQHEHSSQLVVTELVDSLIGHTVVPFQTNEGEINIYILNFVIHRT